LTPGDFLVFHEGTAASVASGNIFRFIFGGRDVLPSAWE
jgi:hypothetical protein